MKKKLYSLLLLLAVMLTANAEEAQWCLVVESAGGETIAIGTDLKPVIKTTSDGYELNYGETKSTFTWSELKKVTIKETVADVSTPIQEVIAEQQQRPTYHVAAGEIRIEGAKPGTLAQIFSLNGRPVKTTRIGADGTVSLSTAGLPNNVYIIKTNKSTFKIVKK